MKYKTTKWLVYTALMTAITAVATMTVSIPSTGGGHTNLSDAIIFMTAVMLDPVAAMIAGGLGTFLADLITYPATMLFSLLFHGIEGLIVGLLIRYCVPKKNGAVTITMHCVYMFIGGLVMIGGFFMAKALGWYGNYGDPTAALASAFDSLVRNFLQVIISIVVAHLLLYPLKLKRLINRDELYGKIEGEIKTETIEDPKNEPSNSDE